VPTRRSPTEFARHLDRLDAIRAFDLRPVAPRGVPPMVIERLARVARQGKPSAIVALQEPRRTCPLMPKRYPQLRKRSRRAQSPLSRRFASTCHGETDIDRDLEPHRLGCTQVI
jgi:hypothetical protein